MFRLLFRWISRLLLVGGAVGAIAATAVVMYLLPRLPSIDNLREVQLQVPLRVYTSDHKLIAEFGEKRRLPLKRDEISDNMVKAVLAAEDERFYRHPGVDWKGLLRAVVHLVAKGEKGPGGSTITMQVARNFFLGREKTYLRKLNEILLALRIERQLSKDEILALYMNKIFLGHRAYGVGAAAQVYYGRNLADLSLAQVAMIAGLPKAPSAFNPVSNPQRARIRRNYVLRRMVELGFVNEPAYETARDAPVSAKVHRPSVDLQAAYVAEMVRAEVQGRLGEQAYTSGFRVYTTIDSRLQQAADRALRNSLVGYDRRHGYRGAEAQLDITRPAAELVSELDRIGPVGSLAPAVVTGVEKRSVKARHIDGAEIEIPWDGLSWARAYKRVNALGPALKTASDAVALGDLIRVRQSKTGWQLVQIPEVNGALVAMDPGDGQIVALSGGFDFYESKYNRAVQARRQPGSSFKPFIYSAAIDHGFTAASFINDAPVVFHDPSLEGAWRPENYSRKFFGPTRLREALYKSRNLVSIRLVRAIGIDYAVDYVRRFGLKEVHTPRNLSLALGTGAFTPLELASGYSVFANGGFRIEPYLIARTENASGEVVGAADPRRVCETCPNLQPERIARDDDPVASVKVAARKTQPAEELLPDGVAPRVLSPENAWLMNSLLRDVIKRGTGHKAMSLKRNDLAGKTGTTNDQQDAWFSGFHPQLVAVAWVGFDKLQPLGSKETGGKAALPMWIDFMAEALKDVPEEFLPQPKGLVTVSINPETGEQAQSGEPDAILETFRTQYVPTRISASSLDTEAGPTSTQEITEQLF